MEKKLFKKKINNLRLKYVYMWRKKNNKTSTK